MTDYTANLKLVLPVFDQSPWDDDINNDLIVIDAAVSKIFGTANLVGIWKNATAYTAGQAVVDATDGSMWTCAVGHTSSVAPATFAGDRSSFPSYWTRIASSAQDYAVQAATYAGNAATSATAAANSATNAASSAAIVAGALPLSGGTLTGPLILAADPTNVLGAATKQYVDARVGGTGFLSLSGGTLSGPLILAANPVTALGASTKQYVDTAVAGYLPLAGGTLTGTVSVGGAGVRYSARPNPSHYYSFDWTGSALNAYVDGSNVGNVALGSYLPLSGGTLSGNLSISSQLTLSLSGARFYTDASYTVHYMDSGNWGWVYQRSTGATWYQRGNDGAQLFVINSSGSIAAAGTVTAGAGIIPYSGDANFVLYQSGGNRVLQWGSGGWNIAWNTSNGSLSFGLATNVVGMSWPSSDWMFRNLINAMAGNGAYVNLSDAAAKSDILECLYGMDVVRGIEPKKFIRTSTEKEEIGFIAQDVQAHVPEAIVDFTENMLGLRSEMLTAVLWNAVRQLDARMTAGGL